MSGLRGSIPEIEEGPVDFGVRLKNRMRLRELTRERLTVESIYSDGNYSARQRNEAHGWDASVPGSRQQVLIKTPDYVVALGHVVGTNTVEVRRVGGADPDSKEFTVLLELLVGTDGAVKDGRIKVSSGNAEVDQKMLEETKKSWKLTPAMVDGQPTEKWADFAVTIKLVD